MQGVPIELGGFKGRTNKLVDGCYAWWVGGCFALLRGLDEEAAYHKDEHEVNTNANEKDEEDWIDDEGPIHFGCRLRINLILCRDRN